MLTTQPYPVLRKKLYSLSLETLSLLPLPSYSYPSLFLASFKAQTASFKVLSITFDNLSLYTSQSAPIPPPTVATSIREFTTSLKFLNLDFSNPNLSISRTPLSHAPLHLIPRPHRSHSPPAPSPSGHHVLTLGSRNREWISLASACCTRSDAWTSLHHMCCPLLPHSNLYRHQSLAHVLTLGGTLHPPPSQLLVFFFMSLFAFSNLLQAVKAIFTISFVLTFISAFSVAVVYLQMCYCNYFFIELQIWLSDLSKFATLLAPLGCSICNAPCLADNFSWSSCQEYIRPHHLFNSFPFNFCFITLIMLIQNSLMSCPTLWFSLL